MLGWVKILNFKLSGDADVWLRFLVDAESRFLRWNSIKICVWTCNMTLTRWTQPSGPLCLWQCFIWFLLTILNSVFDDIGLPVENIFLLWDCPDVGRWQEEGRVHKSLFVKKLVFQPNIFARVFFQPLPSIHWSQNYKVKVICMTFYFWIIFFQENASPEMLLPSGLNALCIANILQMNWYL